MPRDRRVADAGEHVCDWVGHVSLLFSKLPASSYQLLFVTPAMSPSSASLRKHRRQSANLRRKARGRPQRWQRLRRRTLNFGDLASLAIFAVVAIVIRSLRGPERHAEQLQELARFFV